MRLRKMLNCSLIFIMTLAFNMDVFALSGIVNGTQVRIRSGAGTSYGTILDDAGDGNTYTLLNSSAYSTSDGSNGCDTGKWYKISYNNQVGYICSEFFSIVPSSEDDNSGYQSIDLSGSKGVIACYEDATSLPMRDSANGGSTVLNLNCGDQVEILDTDLSNYNGCYSYYKIKSGGKTGYVCGKYVTTTSLSKKAVDYYKSHSLDDYNKSLKSDGFPDSYLPYLDELHARYPNWKFEALNTNMDYSTVTSLESSVGVSLIQGNEVGHRSTAGGSYNYYTDSWNVLDGSNWYAANSATVSYYMDPRLYLKPDYIFMFEKLTYDSKYHTVDKVKNILSSTRLGNYDSGYADYYMEAASKFNVSPLHLASRTRQEIGDTTSVISGEWFDYNGTWYHNLYNTYNIGAYSGYDNWKKGLIFANGGEDGYEKSTYYGRPWDSLKKAIIGGAQFISEGYINNNQYTEYLQKFNVNNGRGSVGVHQYMTNLRAPLSEASSTYSTYSSFGMLDNSFVFTIPVYSNMENMYVLPSPNNPNNYLKELKINGSSVTGFDGAITSYDVYVSSSTSSVSLSAKTVNSGSKISGSVSGTGSASGSINVNEGDNKISVLVTALNGDTRTYTISIHREKATTPSVPTPTPSPAPTTPSDNTTSVDLRGLVTKSGYKLSDNYISGIGINTKASSVINSFKKTDANVNVVVKNSSGKVIESDYVGTGSIIELSEGNSSLKVTIVIYGDASGDGKINSLDLLKVQKHILGINKLTGAYSVAGDASRDGKINSLDLLKIQKHILGINLIKQ